MANEFKLLEVDGLRFYYLKKQIMGLEFNGRLLDQFLQQALLQVSFNLNPENPSKTIVNIPDEIGSLIDALCNSVKQLKNMGENYTAAYLATTVFQGLTDFSESLKNEGRSIHACNYWRNILNFVNDSEDKNNVKIHKGHPYFFLAYYYILHGDTGTGFVYASSAIKQDEDLGELCPELNYPHEAPIYLTTFLVDNPANRMWELVKELRQELNIYITSFNNELNKKFTLQDFDKKFLQNESNPDLKDLRIKFVFCFWSLVELRKKTKSQTLINDFSKLRNLSVIFDFCLIVDKILEANTKIGQNGMGNNVMKVCRHLKILTRKDREKIEEIYHLKINNADPDKVLTNLLPMNLVIGEKKIPKLAICYLIAWNLRNYGGHNIKQQKCLVQNFDDIVEILMKCIICSIELL